MSTRSLSTVFGSHARRSHRNRARRRAPAQHVEILEQRIVPATLVAAYAFNEGTGTTVYDSSGNGNNGTITGATWTTAGKYGDALVFNGTNALVTVNDSTSLHLTTGMTLEAWVNPSTVTSAWSDVIYKGNDNYWLEATSTSGGVPAAGATLGSADVDTPGTAALTTNTWAFLTETYDGSTLRLYVDGTQVSSLAQTGPIATSTNPLQIGGDSIFGQYFAGMIDEIRVYNVALSPQQIVADMNTPIAPAGFGISPHVATLTFTQTQQFTANGTSVIWSVDGVVGGSASSGTITSTGLYTSPNSIGTHTVTATTADQVHSDSATVYVTNYPGTFTYHNDNFRTGENLNETILTPANVNSATFGKLFTYALDGMTFASPLYVAHVNIPGKGFHNVVYVATEHDSVYAFDADGLSSTPLWQVSFINPAAGVTTVPAADTGETGDIPNEIGITGTPVIDPTTGTLYVVAKTKEVVGSTTNYVQRLHALDITTGAEKFGGPVVIQASVPGTGDGASGGQVPFNALRENQRTGLLLTNGVVYFGFSSHGDNPPFHGWVLGYNATTLKQVLVYNDTANGSEGGIWMNGDGLATDSTGNLYFITGNGTFDANTGGNAYGDSFVKMSPTGAVLDYFSPSVQSTLAANDLDLGSGGVLLLPDQSGAHPHEMVSAGKNGTIYLVNRDNMGQFNPNQDQIVQELVNIFPNTLGNEGGNFSSPIYFNGSVYFSPVANAVQAFSLNNGLLSTAPTSQSSEVYNARGGTMAISANGSTNGILWTLQSTGSSSPGILHAYDATNLANELYNSNQAGSRDTLDTWLKFSLPLVANGKVFVAGVSQLTVYGLLPNGNGVQTASVASTPAQTQVSMSAPVGQASAGSSVGPQVAASAFTQTRQYTAGLCNGAGTATAITPDLLQSNDTIDGNLNRPHAQVGMGTQNGRPLTTRSVDPGLSSAWRTRFKFNTSGIPERWSKNVGRSWRWPNTSSLYTSRA